MSKRELIDRELDRLPEQDLDRLLAFVRSLKEAQAEGRAVQRCSGDSIVVKAQITKGPSERMLRFHKRSAEVVLDFARREVVV